jgi:hypothetical protein
MNGARVGNLERMIRRRGAEPQVAFLKAEPRACPTGKIPHPELSFVLTTRGRVCVLFDLERAQTWQATNDPQPCLAPPLNTASGHGVGARAQLLLFLDDLAPSLFGKPLFGR